MKLAALYKSQERNATALHILTDEGYVAVNDLDAAYGHGRLQGLADVGELLRLRWDAVDELRSLAPNASSIRAISDARLAPPVIGPSKIVCVGLNYDEHIKESGASRPERIVLFAKFPSCLIGDGDPVVVPWITAQLDYEGELAVVIGRTTVASVPLKRWTTCAATPSSTTFQRATCRAPSLNGSEAKRLIRLPRLVRWSSMRCSLPRSDRCTSERS